VKKGFPVPPVVEVGRLFRFPATGEGEDDTPAPATVVAAAVEPAKCVTVGVIFKKLLNPT
jgi:hypothetical protein